MKSRVTRSTLRLAVRLAADPQVALGHLDFRAAAQLPVGAALAACRSRDASPCRARTAASSATRERTAARSDHPACRMASMLALSTFCRAGDARIGGHRAERASAIRRIATPVSLSGRSPPLHRPGDAIALLDPDRERSTAVLEPHADPAKAAGRGVARQVRRRLERQLRIDVGPDRLPTRRTAVARPDVVLARRRTPTSRSCIGSFIAGNSPGENREAFTCTQPRGSRKLAPARNDPSRSCTLESSRRYRTIRSVGDRAGRPATSGES